MHTALLIKLVHFIFLATCVTLPVFDMQFDFATNTHSYTDAAVDAQQSLESFRTAEAATTITRDAGMLC